MIVTCPNCTARYKIPEAKIKGRGAKITCPNCAHKFVVYKEGEEGAGEGAPPADIARRDFRKVGITWKVRKGIGLTYDFHDLNTLRDYLNDGQIDENDVISYDHRDWEPLRNHPDLDAFFWDVWKRAEAGEIDVAEDAADGEDDEDAADAPTTIVGQGSSLSDEIRKAVRDATTPVPASSERRGPAGVASRNDLVHSLDEEPSPVAASPVPTPITRPQPAPVPPPEAPAAGEPDPFTNLGKKAQEQPSGRGMTGLIVVVVALLLLVPGVLYLLGVFGTQ